MSIGEWPPGFLEAAEPITGITDVMRGAPSMSMVERVARAIHKSSVGDFPEWDDPTQEEFHDFYRFKARAAIEAMREPTEEMMKAGGDAALDSVSRRADALDAWQAMISAALSEQGE